MSGAGGGPLAGLTGRLGDPLVRRIGWGVFLVVVVALGASNAYILRIELLAAIAAVMTMSLGLVTGFTGQFSIGHAGFMAIGAHTAAVITSNLAAGPARPSTITGHVIFVLAVLAGGLVAALFGFLIGLPTLRLRGDYLAIVTLAFGEVVLAVIRLFEVLGGPSGLKGIPVFVDKSRWYGPLYVVLLLVGASWLMRNFIHSSYGRTSIAVRDNELAADAMGVDTFRQKILAFVISAAIAAIGGGVYAHLGSTIVFSNFSILKSLDFLIFLYVGGASSLSGAALGAVLLTVLPEVFRFLSDYRMVIYPLVLIGIMLLRTQGLMGRREFFFFAAPRYLSERPGRPKGDAAGAPQGERS
jgi:branched-chain amino acid transport system permease protein